MKLEEWVTKINKGVTKEFKDLNFRIILYNSAKPLVINLLVKKSLILKSRIYNFGVEICKKGGFVMNGGDIVASGPKWSYVASKAMWLDITCI